MKVETKFDIYDPVFVLIEDNFYDENGEISHTYYNIKHKTIYYIEISLPYFYKAPLISYVFTDHDRASERYCFETLEEAMKVLKEKQKQWDFGISILFLTYQIHNW